MRKRVKQNWWDASIWSISISHNSRVSSETEKEKQKIRRVYDSFYDSSRWFQTICFASDRLAWIGIGKDAFLVRFLRKIEKYTFFGINKWNKLVKWLLNPWEWNNYYMYIPNISMSHDQNELWRASPSASSNPSTINVTNSKSSFQPVPSCLPQWMK